MNQNEFFAAVKSDPEHAVPPADHTVLLGLLVATVVFFLWQQYHGHPPQRTRRVAPAQPPPARASSATAEPVGPTCTPGMPSQTKVGPGGEGMRRPQGGGPAPHGSPKVVARLRQPKGVSAGGETATTDEAGSEAKAIRYTLLVTVTGTLPAGTAGAGKDPDELTVLLLSRAEGRSLAIGHIGDLLLERLSLFGGRSEARVEYLLMCYRRGEKFPEAAPRALLQDQAAADAVAACQAAAAKSLAHLLHRAAQASPRPEIVSYFAKRIVRAPVVGEGIHAGVAACLEGMRGSPLGRVYGFVVEELCKLHRKTSIELYSGRLLSTLVYLTSIPSVAEVIVAHKKWLVPHPNGRHLEELTLFGEAFSVTSTSQGCISKYFGDKSTSDLSSWEYDMNEIIAALADCIRNMLMREGSRDGMLRWLGSVVTGNRERAPTSRSSPSFLAIVFNAAARASTGAFARATQGIAGDFSRSEAVEPAGDSVGVANALNRTVADLAVVSIGPTLREQGLLGRRSRALKSLAKRPHYTFHRHQQEVAVAALSGRASALKALLGTDSLVGSFVKFVDMNNRLASIAAPGGTRHAAFTDLCATVLLMGTRRYGRDAPVFNPAGILPLCQWVCAAARLKVQDGPSSGVGRWLSSLRAHMTTPSCAHCKELKGSSSFYAQCLGLLTKMDRDSPAAVESIRFCSQIAGGNAGIVQPEVTLAAEEMAAALVANVDTHLSRAVEAAEIIAYSASRSIPPGRAIPFQRTLAHSAAYVLEATVLVCFLSQAGALLDGHREKIAGLAGWGRLHQRTAAGRISRMHGLNVQLLKELGAFRGRAAQPGQILP